MGRRQAWAQKARPVLCSLFFVVFVFAKGDLVIRYINWIMASSLADNDVFFRISRVCYILLSYFRPNIICMWCQGAADAVSVLIVSRWRCIPASCAGSKLSQREESGGDSSRAKYRDPALLQPLSYFLFSVFLFLSLTKILQKYPGVMVF